MLQGGPSGFAVQVFRFRCKTKPARHRRAQGRCNLGSQKSMEIILYDQFYGGGRYESSFVKINVVPSKAQKSNMNAKGLLGIANKLMTTEPQYRE